MSHFVRASKYRHVFVEAPKHEDCYSGFRLATATGEQNYIKANSKFFSVALQGGGGPFAVVPFENTGRYEAGTPVIAGHSSAVLDFEFNPFHEHLIASASDDTTVKVWGIPENGLTETISEPLVDLRDHGRKVTLLRFHPTASNVLSSVSADMSVKIWDIEKGSAISSLDGFHPQLMQDVVWDYMGTCLATTCKDKTVRIFDARSGAAVVEKANAHEGSKSMKLSFLGAKNKLVSVGFTRQSNRQLKIWDPRNMDTEVKKIDIDQAAGVLMPFYDPDTSVLYLAGKGDGNVRYYEIIDENPHCFPLSEYRSTTAAKGMAMVPKRGLDIMGCETARMLKLTSNSVEPLKFVVPRKSDSFQDDIFPDTFSGVASHTADEWLAGSDKPPETMSLQPGARPAAASGGGQTFTAPKTALQLQKELNDANARIEALEKKLRDAGIEP